MGQRFNPQPLPPEVQQQIDAVVSKMMDKVRPELNELTAILHSQGLSSGSIELGVGGIPSPLHPLSDILGIPVMTDASMGNGAFKFAPPPPKEEQAPANDLLEGVTQILNIHFGVNQNQVLGMILDKNRNAAYDIAKVLEEARKRDQQSVARELENIIKKLK